VNKIEVVVFNHDFEEGTSQEGSPSAANPVLGSPSGSSLQIANRDQIGVSDCSHVGAVQGHECLGSSGGEDKLDLKTIRCVNINDRAKIAATETVLGQVSIQDDGVEQVEHDYPGCAVTKCGESWPFEIIQTVTTLA
jgi:hypothetical protein